MSLFVPSGLYLPFSPSSPFFFRNGPGTEPALARLPVRPAAGRCLGRLFSLFFCWYSAALWSCSVTMLRRFLSVLLLLPLFCSLTVLSVAQAGAVQPSLAGAAKENYTVDTEPGFYKSPAYRNMLTMDRIEYDWLYKINMDFIKNGLAAYYKSGDKDYMRRALVSKGYKFHIAPTIDERWEVDGRPVWQPARLASMATHVYSDLFCDYQQEYKGDIYEYWLLEMGVNGREYGYRYCEFIITKAPAREALRSLIYQSTKFVREYKVDDAFTIVYPQTKFEATMLGQGLIRCPGCCDGISR